MTTQLNDRALMPFVEYCASFYSKGGVYDMGATLADIMKATRQRLKNKDVPFDGDTVDRELVRDILLDDFGYTFP